MAIKIDYSKCCWKDGKCQSCACGLPAEALAQAGGECVGCAEACSIGAITRGERVEIDAGKCLQCGACVAACQHGALSVVS